MMLQNAMGGGSLRPLKTLQEILAIWSHNLILCNLEPELVQNLEGGPQVPEWRRWWPHS